MMILAFSDLHLDELALRELKGRAANCELIICAGDLSNFGNGLRKVCEEINNWGKRALIIPGNNETNEQVEQAIEGLINLENIHEKKIRIGNYWFAGIGGGLPSHFNTPFEMQEADFKELLEKFKGLEKLILISHAPPYGVLDQPRPSTYMGSKELLKFVKHEKPLIVLCGHCHEQAGKEESAGNTRVINLGKHGLIIEL